jgi:hypothetical protein
MTLRGPKAHGDRLATCGRLAIGLALAPKSFLPSETFPPRELFLRDS